VDDQSQRTQRDVPVPTDVRIIQSRNRPAKERADQLSPPPCLHRGSLPKNTARGQSRSGAKSPTLEIP
jgi:hypothetical protein